MKGFIEVHNPESGNVQLINVNCIVSVFENTIIMNDKTHRFCLESYECLKEKIREATE